MALLDQCAEFAASADDRELAEAVAQEQARLLRDAHQCPVVVVVGATKAGKSSLVNALLGRPGISPVDASVATNAYIQFLAAESPYARVHAGDSMEPHSIELEWLGEWVTEQGNPNNTRGVRCVEVGLPAKLLEHVSIVDTPGVGGLNSDHVALTLFALGMADALLFVVDAQRELSASALAFLRQAARRIDTVLIAVTKKDKFRGSSDMLQADRRLLDAHEPALARSPMLLVSSLLAERALDEPPELAAALLEEAGIAELEALVREHVGARADQLATANAVKLAVSVLQGLERSTIEQIAAVSSGADFGDTLAEELARLQAALDETAEWRPQIELGLERIADRQLDEFKSAMTRLSDTFQERGRSSGGDEIERLFQQLDIDLTAEVTRLMRATASELPDLIADTMGRIDNGSRLDEAVDEFAGGDHAIRTARPLLERPQRADQSAFAALRIASQTMTGVNMFVDKAGLVATAAGGPHVAVATLAISTVYTVVQHRRQAAKARTRVSSAIAEEIQRALRTASLAYEDHIKRLRREARRHVDELITLRTRELEELARMRERAERQAADEREREVETLRRRVDEMRASADRAKRLLAWPKSNGF